MQRLTILIFIIIGFAVNLKANEYFNQCTDLMFGFYHNIMSPVKTPVSQCQFSPSCSEYSSLAIKEFGALKGILMTTDRLMRCSGGHADRENYPMKNYKFIDNPCNHSLFGDGMLWSIGLSSMNDKPTINEDSIFDFSKHLFVKGEIQLSKLELSRIAYNKNHNQLTIQKANLLLALCEFLDDKILKTIDIVSDLDKIDDMELKYNYFILNYLAGDSKKLYEYNINLCLKNDFNSKESITDKLLVYTYYINGELDKSIDLLEKLSITEKNIGLDTIPCYLKENFKKNIKSPLLAGIMSTIIPGSGYVYSGRYKEGISAFLINGLLGIGIYSLFDSGNIGSGVLTSMVCLPFYLGNIIGASNAAATENNKYQQYILLNLRNSLKISFVFSTGQLLEFWN